MRDALNSHSTPVKATVVIPVHNGVPYIRASVDSALQQTLAGTEVVVVDDGSTDGTLRILEEYGPRIKVVVQPGKKGQAAALNAGIDAASGEYIALLDADDLCLPDRLRKQCTHLDAHPECGMVFTARYQIDAEGARHGEILSQHVNSFGLLQHNPIARSSVMLRRQCWSRVGPFDVVNTGNDDWDMWVRISEHYRIDYLPECLIEYRIHAANLSTTRARKLDFNRVTRLRMLEAAAQRRGNPVWLRILVLRAHAEWMVGRAPWIGERFPVAWWRLGKLLAIAERVLLWPIRFRGI